MSKTKWHAKAIYLLVALALVVSLGVVAAPHSQVAAAGTYYVDNTYGNDSNSGAACCPWKTITFALTQVSDGDTIIVKPGTYNATNGETFPLNLDKANLAIKSSDGAASTIVEPTSNDASAFNVSAAGVTIGGSGFTIVSGGRAGIYADETGGNGITVQDCIFKSYADGESRGMWFEKLWNGALVTGNSFTTPRVGTAIMVVNADGATIRDNTVATGTVKYCFLTFKAEAFYPGRDSTKPFAEYVAENPSTIDDVLVTGNSVDGVISGPGTAILFAASTKPADHGEPQAQNLTVSSPGVTISGNDFTNNTVGVKIDADTPAPGDASQVAHILGVENIHINWNNIVGNANFGVQNGQDQVVDAENNWWGDPSGPSHSPGLGDKVSNNVDYCPWLDGSYPGGSPISPSLAVNITAPANNSSVEISHMFAVTAVVTNEGGATATDVSVSLGWGSGENVTLVGGNLTYNVGDISPNSTQEINWNLHCTGEGDVHLAVNATESRCCDTVQSKVVVVHQPPVCLPCGINVTLDEGDGRDICVCNNFTVTGNVTNTGLAALSSVSVNLTVTGGNATVISTNPFFSTLGVDETQPLSWTLHCENATLGDCPANDWVSVNATASGTCTGCPGTVSANATASNVVNQKWLIVDITPETCHNYCTGDEFLVYGNVTNCYTHSVTGTANITVTGHGHLTGTVPWVQALTVGPGETTPIPLPWHVKCDDAGDVNVTVVYSGVTTDAKTLCDEDISTVHQFDPASLSVEASASSNCTAVCNNFTVTANITNTGGVGAANITGGTATISPHGGMSTSENLTKNLEPIAGNQTVSVNWTFHCVNSTNASFTVNATGTDSVCGGTVSNTTGTVNVTQVDLGVDIITPADNTTYSVCQTFCVTANITNTDLDNILTVHDATISINGTAELVTGENATKLLSSEGALNMSQTQQVSWTLHCYDSGDAVITVTANVTDPCHLLFSKEITVHQETPAELEQVILSPSAGAEIATSQDFAVTAKVTNVGEADALGVNVTLDPGANASVVSPGGETQTVNIPGNSSKTLTWTVHCDGSGNTTLSVSAVGEDENSGDQVSCEVPSTVTIHQYPAAHLEVNITEYPTVPVTVCDTFNITATITNTGEADAWEASATLSVFPEGSARVVAGDVGYTQDIGTLAGHGQNGTATVTWTMHCKVACESTITITAAGYDEYGWHLKQDPSTGETILVSMPGRAIDARFIEPDSVTVKQIEPAQLVVDISYPANGAEFTASHNFTVTGTVTNIGEETADNVSATLTIDANASPTPQLQGLADIAGGQSRVVTYTVHCDSAGYSVMTVTADADNADAALDTVTVKQGEVPDAQLVVDILTPKDGTELTAGENFIVNAKITNIGQTEAQTVNVTMDAGDHASIVSGPSGTWPRNIRSNDQVLATWTLSCDTVGFSVIVVDAAGNNTNSALDCVTVKQIAPPGPFLTVDVSAPAQIYVGDGYNVTAVVSNIGDADAAGVNATLAINGPASTTDSSTKAIGAIAAGSSDSVTWDLTCTGAGGVTVTVTAVGTNTNTVVGAAAIQQGVIMWSGLDCSPTEGYAPLDITVSANLTNSGDMAANTEAKLKVNGDVVDSKVVTIGAGAMQTVSFAYTLGAETCEVTNYQVTINGLDPVTVTVDPMPPVTWQCPLDHVALIAPAPGNDRPSLDVPADLVDVGYNMTWFQVLWLNEATGEWLTYFSEFTTGNTLHTLEPGKVYYVVVSQPGDLTIPQC